MKYRVLVSIQCLIAITAFSAVGLAHSGNTFVAAIVKKPIKIDGDLSDWPTSREYKLSVPYLFNGKPDTPDFTGRFRVGCDLKRETLYVGVEVKDDVISLKSPVDRWNARDTCEVFLTLSHSAEQTVPLQFVYRKTPIVAEADQPNQELQECFSVVRRQQGNRLTYEWRIDLSTLPGGKGTTKKPAVLGFDVGYIDLDTEGDIAVFSSSPGKGKHLTSATLGDLFVLGQPDSLVEVTGEVMRAPAKNDQNGEVAKQDFPPVAIRRPDLPNLYVQVPCDTSGRYRTQLPPGKYTSALVDTLPVPVSGQATVDFEVPSGKTPAKVPVLQMRPLRKPELIDETGILLRQQFDPEQVDQFVRAFMDYHRIPGLSLAILKGGEIVYGKGFGVKSLASREPVSNATVFEVASMTKPMFAFAVCRLAERGIIDLDTPLWKYLPYADIAHDDRYKKITARMVLCHRTGFPNWRDGQLKIHFEPGTQQRYSGEAYGYLAKVGSHLIGKDISTVMSEEVFSPFGIENTFLTWDENADDSLVAMPHDRNNTPIMKSRWSHVWVAGCLHVNARNFAKFLQAVINEQGLSDDAYAEMLRPQAAISKDSKDQNFGLGFVVGESEFGKHYRHGGHNVGFTSAFEIYPDRKFGYVFMVNNYQAVEFEKDLRAFLVTGKTECAKCD